MIREAQSLKPEDRRPVSNVTGRELATGSIVDPVPTVCGWKILSFVYSFTVSHLTVLRR